MLELSILKQKLDKSRLFERSWIEQKELFAKNEEENGDVLLNVKRTEYLYFVKVFWKSPFSHDQSGMICVSHSQLNCLSIKDIEQILSNARKIIEDQIGSSINTLKI